MILYTSGYKYQLTETYTVHVGVLAPLGEPITTDFIDLDCLGRLTIRRGYAWDGPSGPTVDTRNFMRGSLVHDALYQLMRMQKLPVSARGIADKALRSICKDDGMSAIRAWWVYWGVFVGGEAAASPSNVKEIHTAP